MARKKTTARSKLIGWSVLAAGIVVIVGIFLVSRGSGPPASSGVAAASSATASTASVAEASPPSTASAPAPASSAIAAAPPEAAASSEASSSSALLVVEPDSMDQASRKALVTALIGQGVFTGVQVTDSPPKVGVTPLFQGLSADLQQQFIATVYAYVNNGAAGKDPLELIDATTGKTIGTYTAADGLKLS